MTPIGSELLFASTAPGRISHPREIEQKRYASVRIFTVLVTRSSGSSTRSSTVGVWQPATTSSEPTTSHSSSLHQYGCGCALMSPRPTSQSDGDGPQRSHLGVGRVVHCGVVKHDVQAIPSGGAVRRRRQLLRLTGMLVANQGSVSVRCACTPCSTVLHVPGNQLLFELLLRAGQLHASILPIQLLKSLATLICKRLRSAQSKEEPCAH